MALTVITGCKKDDDPTDATKLKAAIIGDFPNTQYFNELKEMFTIVPLSSNVPIFINPDNLNTLLSKEVKMINMAFRKGFPITIFKANQASTNKLIELTGYILPIKYDHNTPEILESLSLVSLPGESIDYIVQDEIPQDDISFHVQDFYNWINEIVERSGENNLKSINLANDAYKFTHPYKFTPGKNVTLQVTSYIQAVYSCGDNLWYVFPNITLSVSNPNSIDFVQLQATGYFINSGSVTTPSYVFDPVPPQTSTETNYSKTTNVSFTSGVSVGLLGPSVSFKATASFSNTTSGELTSTYVQNLTNLNDASPMWKFIWNNPPGFGNYPISWYWQFPYVESDASLSGTTLAAYIGLYDGSSTSQVGNDYEFYNATFQLPKKKCSDW